MKRDLATQLQRLLREVRTLNTPQDEMKVLKRLRLRLKDRIAALERSHNGPSVT